MLLGTNSAAQFQLAPTLKPDRVLRHLSPAGPNFVGVPRASGLVQSVHKTAVVKLM